MSSLLVDHANFPRDIPLHIQDAVMVFEPTDLYGVHDVGQWESLSAGSGWVKLPTPVDERPYAVSMYHQLHCLNFLRYDLTQSKKGVRPTAAVLGHANHCYNYLRMGILCSVDLTLEPRIVEELTCDGPKPSPTGVPHVCRDWARIHEYVGKNYRRNEGYLNSVLSGP
ncbi:hypothetical protein NMY22_g16608 [Coprinellus aureogranulatus]|nr:hypothetical protein NMY22_g16608 [Coprinellus aureogranulatus]